MSKKRKKKKKGFIDPEAVLSGKESITAYELVQLIHRINPTHSKDDLHSSAVRNRYHLKSALQSLLIRRFGDSLKVTQPAADNPKMLSLELKQYTENACHVFIHELDDDARSWAQGQIDEALVRSFSHSDPSSTGHSQSRRIDKKTGMVANESDDSISKLSGADLIERGQQALAEYEYTAAENFFKQAMVVSRNSVNAVIAMLEFWIEQVGDFDQSLALSKSLPRSVKKDERVRSLLGLAAARKNQIWEALESIGSIANPETCEVHQIALKYFIKSGDLDSAKKQLSTLKTFESDELDLDIPKLVKEVESLRNEKLKPLEEEIKVAWTEGRAETALQLANSLLLIHPENGAALSILAAHESREKGNRIRKILEQADKAEKLNDPVSELDYLKQAIAIGANAGALEQRLEIAGRKARRCQESKEIMRVQSLWDSHQEEEALSAFSKLNAKQRREFQSGVEDPQFRWLDAAITSRCTIKTEKRIRAVQLLKQAQLALVKKEIPEALLIEIKEDRKIFRNISEAEAILHDLEIRFRKNELLKSEQDLENGIRFLEAGKREKAKELIGSIRGNLLSENDQQRFEELKQKLNRLESFQLLQDNYHYALIQKDHFLARKIASQLAQLCNDTTANHWREIGVGHTASIRREWCFNSIENGEFPRIYGTLSRNSILGGSKAFLLPEQNNILLVNDHQQWVFLHVFNVAEQKIIRSFTIRTPRCCNDAQLYWDTTTVWLIGGNGLVIELSLNLMDILFYGDFHHLIGDQDSIEMNWFCPKSRCLWLYILDRNNYNAEQMQVIDVDKGVILRTVRCSNIPEVVSQGREYHVLLHNQMSNSLDIYSERGKPLEQYQLDPIGWVTSAVMHPNGKDYVLIRFLNPNDLGGFGGTSNEESDNDFLLTLEIHPDPDKKYQKYTIENSHGELMHGIYMAKEKGILFVYFGDNTEQDKLFYLAAFKFSSNGFEHLYTVDAPFRISFITDKFSTNVVALLITKSGIRGIILDEKNPHFEIEGQASTSEAIFPRFNGLWICNLPKGEINAHSMALMMSLRQGSFEDAERLIRDTMTNDKKTVEDFTALIYALERSMYLEEARQLRIQRNEKFPNSPRVLVDQAFESAALLDWDRTISRLEDFDSSSLDEGIACHACHILGLCYFATGKVDQALQAWQKGTSYENGRCQLSPYIEYAQLSLMSREERKNQYNDSKLGHTFETFETIDACLEKKQWSTVIEIIENLDVAYANESQIFARLAEAYLQENPDLSTPVWLKKVIALSKFCDRQEKSILGSSSILPPGIETWPDDKLKDLVEKAMNWIQSC